MKNYCIFEYLYRDADNYKAFGEILLTGKVTDNNIEELKSLLDSGEYFVAEQVGIPTLYSQLWKYSNGPTVADHAYHEFSELRPATSGEVESMDLWGDVESLLSKFRCAGTHWDCMQSVHCSGNINYAECK